jgi:quinol monooxygenase YgiN
VAPRSPGTEPACRSAVELPSVEGRILITVSIRLTIAQEHWVEAVSTLRALLEPTRLMPGCEGFGIFRDLEDEHALLIAQRWASEEDLARHVGGRDFRRILAVIELAAEAPHVEITTASTCRGMELIEALNQDAGE